MPENSAFVRQMAPGAEAGLAAHFGRSIRWSRVEMIGVPRPRSHVWRCWIETPGPDLPATVIVKSMRGTQVPDFDPAPRSDNASLIRLARECAGARLLTERAGQPLGPRVLSVDRETGYIVLEDLGSGGNLAQVLLDPAATPAAATGMLARYADGLAAQHLATLGQRDAFAAHMADVLPDPKIAAASLRATAHTPGLWLRDDIPALLASCNRLDVAVGPGLASEAEAIARAVDDADGWLALSTGDCCPDNHILAADGSVRFLDFEGSSFRHAFLDLAYLRMPFPTCWCVNRLPAEAVAAAERAYRARMAAARPEILDDAIFYPALARFCAFWAIHTLYIRPDKGFHLDGALAEDVVWGRSTVRQRHVLRLENAYEVCRRYGALPATAALLTALAARLRAEWGAAAEMPLFAAYSLARSFLRL